MGDTTKALQWRAQLRLRCVWKPLNPYRLASRRKRLNAVCYVVKISARTDHQNVHCLITYHINCIQITQEIQGFLLVLSWEWDKKGSCRAAVAEDNTGKVFLVVWLGKRGRVCQKSSGSKTGRSVYAIMLQSATFRLFLLPCALLVNRTRPFLHSVL